MIKIKITPNRCGHIHLEPISKKAQKRCAESNKYSGHHDAYLQTPDEITSLLDFLCSQNCKQINNGYSITVLMDEYDYCHQFVGGQLG